MAFGPVCLPGPLKQSTQAGRSNSGDLWPPGSGGQKSGDQGPAKLGASEDCRLTTGPSESRPAGAAGSLGRSSSQERWAPGARTLGPEPMSAREETPPSICSSECTDARRVLC